MLFRSCPAAKACLSGGKGMFVGRQMHVCRAAKAYLSGGKGMFVGRQRHVCRAAKADLSGGKGTFCWVVGGRCVVIWDCVAPGRKYIYNELTERVNYLRVTLTALDTQIPFPPWSQQRCGCRPKARQACSYLPTKCVCHPTCFG